MPSNNNLSWKSENFYDWKGDSTTLREFFSNIIKTLAIPKFDPCDTVSDDVNDPTLKTILKCRKHPSVLTMQE